MNSEEIYSHKLSLSFWAKLKYVTCAPVLLPLRFIFSLMLPALTCLMCMVALVNTDSQSRDLEPFTGCRRFLQDVMFYLGRTICYLQGFRFEVKGHQVSREEAPILIAAPHTSFFDVWVICLCHATPLARRENKNAPIIWAPQALAQLLFVRRRSADSRHKAKDDISQRATSPLSWRQLIIFPEGTTSNGKALTRFYTGAFRPGVPVQPVTIKYSHPELSIWTWKSSHGMVTSLLLQFCNPFHKIAVEFLPVYNPSLEEQEDPILFANNVQKIIADSLQIKATDVTSKKLE